MIVLRRLKPWLWVAGLSVLCLGLEMGAYAVLGLSRVGPCLVAALVVSATLCLGHNWGIPLAVVLGLVMDSLAGWGLGLNMLWLTLVASVAGIRELRIHADAAWLSPALCAGAVLLGKLLMLAVSYISRNPLPVTWNALFQLAVVLLTTGLVSLGIHFVLYRQLQPAVEDAFMASIRMKR